MCTLLFAWQVDPARPLIVAANRDEFYARPTAPASSWPRDDKEDDDAPEIVAGRDLQAGGTWLGVTRAGRFAALTNVREPFVAPPPGARSRGGLVAEFLRGRAAPGDYLAGLALAAYAGFNLVVGDRSSLWYLSNRSGPARSLGPGVYGVSNAALDTPWPKVRRGRENLARLVAAGEASPEAVLALLADRAPAPDAELPETGVGLAMERVLSPLCIVSPGYGTRSSTALTIHRDGTVEFRERSHDATRVGDGSDVSITMSRER